MKYFKFNFSFVCILIGFLGIQSKSHAQVDYSELISGERSSYPKIAVIERGAVPYAPVREADIKYTKRVIRCIDTRQKTNKVIVWPKSSLSYHLHTALSEGSIVPYRNDSLSSFYNPIEFKDRFSYKYFSPVIVDSITMEIEDVEVQESLRYTDINKFWVLEEWNFNYKLSVFQPRIIAIAPIYKPVLAAGSVVAGEQPLCWIDYNNQTTRNMFAGWELFNRYNDAARLSMDDLFQMRLFDSYIVFENNVFDSFINQYQEFEDDQIAALLKAEEVRNDLFIFEHDLWQY
jgi:gliding motility associated protien GldN